MRKIQHFLYFSLNVLTLKRCQIQFALYISNGHNIFPFEISFIYEKSMRWIILCNRYCCSLLRLERWKDIILIEKSKFLIVSTNKENIMFCDWEAVSANSKNMTSEAKMLNYESWYFYLLCGFLQITQTLYDSFTFIRLYEENHSITS